MKFEQTEPRINLRALLLIVTLILTWWPSSAISMQQGRASAPALQQTLTPGVPGVAEIAAGETHVWQIQLFSGDYLRLSIGCKYDKLAAKLFAPDPDKHVEEKPLLSTTGRNVMPGGAERRMTTFLFVAEDAGTYRLETSLLERKDTPLPYEVKIEVLRPITPHDRLRIDAVKTELEGDVFSNQPPTQEGQLLAMAKYKASLAIWRELGDRQSEARLLTQIGALYRRLGDLHSTFSYHTQARQIAQELGDLRRVANLTLSIGLIHGAWGESQQALESYHQVRQLFAGLSDRFGETRAIQSIGRVYLALGETQMALDYLNPALQTYSIAGNTLNQCSVLNLLGLARRYLGEYQEALQLHQRALEIAREQGYEPEERTSLGGLGNVYLALGDREKATEYFNQLFKMCQRAGGNKCMASALLSLGHVSFASGENERAVDYLKQSLNLVRRMGVRRTEATTLCALARAYYSMGNLAEARTQIEAALEIGEFLRANIPRQDLRASYFGDVQSDFDLYIEVLMSLHREQPAAGYDALALRASERARARNLLEQLAENHFDLGQDIDPQLRESARTLQQQLNAEAAARANALGDQGSEFSALDSDRKISDLMSRYRDVEAQIRASNPRYAALTRPEPLSLEEIQRQLLDQNTILLEFALGEERSWLWVVTPQAIISRQLPSRSEIENATRAVYRLLTARQPNAGLKEEEQLAHVSEADAKFQTAAQDLSRMLLGPIGDSLCGEWKEKRLLIVADGALQYLPFGALPTPDSCARPGVTPVPLITDHEIVDLPSASVLEVIRRETAGRVPARKMLAVMADPVFEANDPRLGMVINRKNGRRSATVSRHRAGTFVPASPAGSSDISLLMRSIRTMGKTMGRSMGISMNQGGFGRLPFSRDEARAIASLVPAKLRLKATSFQASRARVMSGELADYRILHFATHGLLNSEHPELSGLVLSLVDKNGKSQDGFLRMHEIYNLRLPAEMVVLSACQTGLGKEIKGEGLIGLTRGFMYAGAQRIVASLWRVDDDATANLMTYFYHGMLKDHLRPAAALRAAQLEMMKQKRWSSPYFWAAFVMQGEWR